MTSSTIGLGIIGAGVIGETFCQAFTLHGAYKVLAVCDANPQRATSLAHKFQAEAYSSYEELLQRTDIQLIYLGIPPKYHSDFFRAAVEAGKHVLCEKPLCLSNEEAATMTRVAEEASSRGIVTAINYPLHYVKALAQFKQLLAAGYAGELRRINLKLHFPHWPRAWQNYQRTDWINCREQGGPLREIGSHFFFALLSLLAGHDALSRVNAHVHYPADPTQQAAETSVLGSIALGSGGFVQVDLLSDLPSLAETVELTAHGTQGTISLVDFQTLLVAKNNEDLRLYDETNKIAPNQLMSSAFVVEEMAQAILHRRDTPSRWNLVPIKTGAQVQRILQALYHSQGQWIDLAEPASNSITYLTAEQITKPLPIFSHASSYQGLVHVSCIQGFIPGTFDFPSSDAAEQAEQVLKNLQTVLRQSNSDLKRILKLTIYFVAMQEDFPGVNAVINRYFPEHPPARSSLGVAELPRNARIVMDCTAARLDFG